MPAKTHVVKAVFLVLCLSMLALQNGCSNSGSGQAEAPASNANAVSLALSTTSGFTTVVADGRSTLPVRIQVAKGSGAPMAGVPVTFATTAGALSESPVLRVARDLLSTDLSGATRADSNGSVTVTTDTNGVAQVLLTAGTTAGTAAVTADALGFRTHIDIFFIPGPAARVQLNASPNAVNISGTSNLTATVTDANGNLVPGETVTFTLSTNTSGASLSPTSASTDINGQVTVKYTAGTTAGADTVRAQVTSTSVAMSTSITVTAPAGTGGPVTSRIDLLVSSPQLDSDGTKNVTLTALVRDAANNVLSGIPVSFRVPPPSSASIQVTNGTTGATGTATALLTTGGDPSNRTITVTATIGNLSSTNSVQVTGTTLSLSGATALVFNSTTRLAILLRDSGGKGIPNRSVILSSDLGNPLSATTVTTDFTGGASVDVTARIAGTDTLRASALGATDTATLAVSSANTNFFFTTPPDGDLLDVSIPGLPPVLHTVTLHWDEGGVNQVGQIIDFFATRGTLSPSNTSNIMIDQNGNATVTIVSTDAGPSVISAVARGGTRPSTQVNIQFVSRTVAPPLVLQAFPVTLGVNAAGNSTQQSIITAIVRDARGNLVEGLTVSFTLSDTSGGRIFPASAVTDSFGRASTVYTAGTVPTAQNGVIINATVSDGTTTVTGQVTLTVAQQALFVILGTGNLIQALSSTTYALPYSVLVTDANGNPSANATVELNLLPTRYEKGFYVTIFVNTSCTGWGKNKTINITQPEAGQTCDNEDVNHNGVLDPGEDTNHNNLLDPGNVATVPGSVVTDANGFGFFNVVYAKEFTWVEVALQARTTVTGSAGSSRVVFFLPGLASDFSDCTVSPPGRISPYGTATTCSCDEAIAPPGTCPFISPP